MFIQTFADTGTLDPGTRRHAPHQEHEDLVGCSRQGLKVQLAQYALQLACFMIVFIHFCQPPLPKKMFQDGFNNMLTLFKVLPYSSPKQVFRDGWLTLR